MGYNRNLPHRRIASTLKDIEIVHEQLADDKRRWLVYAKIDGVESFMTFADKKKFETFMNENAIQRQPQNQ